MPRQYRNGGAVTLAITIVHIIASMVLIMFVLLHAGRGGGLSDMFGGGMGVGGSSVAEKNLDRLTVIASLVFTITTVLLHFRFQ
ncbi:MAG: preprotein translocase subunit SecG [Actinomycetota bacterium]